AGVDTIIDGPWRTARLYIEEAAQMRDPRQRMANLELARQKLHDAWGMANSATRRSAVAQEFTALCVLVNDRSGAERWLQRARSESDEPVKDQSREVVNDVIKAGRKPRTRHTKYGLDPNYAAAVDYSQSVITSRDVQVSAIQRAISALVALTHDAALLRQLS